MSRFLLTRFRLNKSIRLIIIITDLNTGGAEIMLLKLLQHIDRMKFDPVVISIQDMGECGSKIVNLNIPVFTLGMRPGIPGLLPFFRLIFLLRRLMPDVVHTWMYHADLLGGLAARLAGIRTVVWCLRNSDLSPTRTKMATRIVVRLCAFVSSWLPLRILTCSDRASAIHIDVGYPAGKMCLIPNGFDLERFVPDINARKAVRTELNLSDDVQLIGLIARDDPQKNHFGFINAAMIVHQVMPDVHFLLAGSGIDYSNHPLVQRIEESGLRCHFHLLGRRDDIPCLMASLDLLASPSFGEAFPNVLGEAMACGVPCVVTDVGDSADIIGETGRVVDSGDMASFARHLIALLQLPVEERSALGERARMRVRDMYEINDIARHYEDLYVRLLREA